MTRAALALLAGVLLAGCGGLATPTPTPAGFSDVIAQLVLRGVTVHEHVSGDDGCERVGLHDNAARLGVSMAGDPVVHDIYLFRWRRAADYDEAASDFFFCVGDFRSQNPGVVVEVVERSPWRAYGADWSDALLEALEQALQ